MIVLTVHQDKLVILCKSGNAALIYLIFRAIPGSGKFIYSFNIKFMAFYNQHYFFVLGRNSKLKVVSYQAQFKMHRNKKGA